MLEKTKIYATIFARCIIWLVMAILFVGFFAIYLATVVSELYMVAYDKWVLQTKAIFAEYDVKLNGKA